MGMFLIGAVLFGVLIGSFFGMIFTSSMYGWKRAVGMFVTMLITGCIISGMMCLEQSDNDAMWNNGVCPHCEEKWEFANASKYRGKTTYFWNCPDCGIVIEQKYQR